MRLAGLVAAASLGLGVWAPSAEATTGTWPSLSGVWAWLTSADTSAIVPRQALGNASGSTHQVPASMTRTQVKSAGTAPGTGPGQLPAYHAHGPSGHTAMSGPDVKASGFEPGKSVLVPRESSATTRVYRNPNGTTTVDQFAGVANYQSSPGNWEPVDSTLVAGAGGQLRERANSLQLGLAPSAAASGLATMGTQGGPSMSFGVAGAAAVAGVTSGPTVTYPGAMRATDVVETATPVGLEESLVLHSASAPSSFVFPLTLSGLTAVAGANRSVSLVDGAGAAQMTIPPAVITDAARDKHSGLPTAQITVGWQLVAYNGGQALSLTLPTGWLPDPSRVFPVTVDPTAISFSSAGSTYTQAGTLNADNAGNYAMKVGTYNGGTNPDVARTFLSFSNFGQHVPAGSQITAASLYLWDAWAWNCGAKEPVDTWAITSPWNLHSISSPGPSLGTFTGQFLWYAPSAACTNTSLNPADGGWISVPFTSDGLSVLTDWSQGIMPNYGIAVTADNEDDVNQWKQINGNGAPENNPYLQLTYAPDGPPQIGSVYPQNNYDATSLTPELQASGSDPDNPANALGYYFAVYSSSNTLVANSTMSPSPGSPPGAAPGCSTSLTGWLSNPDWTVPEGELTWGQTYYWEAVVCNGAGAQLGYSQAAYFTTQVPQPTVGQATQNTGTQGVRPGGSDYTTSVTDADVSTVGPSLSIQRDYDSQKFSTAGAFGAGWSSVLDMKVTPGLTDAAGSTDTVVVTYPDGSQVGFGKNYNGSFTAPQGRYATLAAISGGFTLTDKNDTVYKFGQSLGGSAYGITSITDALGNQLAFSWNSSGEITQMTAASGRSLIVSWQTQKQTGAQNLHVSRVSTNPVTGSDQSTDLTWTYAYSGDELTSVCPPISTTACTTYAYTAGTDFPNAMLATSPHSYWRLDESSGALTAESSVFANEQADAATYTNVTLGQPGPLPGSTATATSFNGSSSYVKLPSSMLPRSSYQSVSLWFKTTNGDNESLFSTQQVPLTGSSSPVASQADLYIGNDGKLVGEFWGLAAPMESPGLVTDGNWHLATLVKAGSTAYLYVNGNQVATGSVTPNDLSWPYDYVGAGYLGAGWPDEKYQDGNTGASTATYFNGSISDVATWDRPLTAAEVTGLYQAGSVPPSTAQAGQLSQITRPSTSIYSQVAYSTVTGAVTQVTDDNGGVWQVNPPTVTGSSQVYVSAVLGQDPADYWRLNDNGGASTAANQVSGGTATYNAVTQGAAGPFADSTADSFDGTSSYVALPQIFAGASSASVELWFKTTATSGAMLLGSSGNSQPTSSGGAPVLWVGTDGKLYGNMWTTSGSKQLASSAAVNDGTWHMAALTASPDSLSLYLDGNQVATASTSALDMAASPYMWLGAGPTGIGWDALPASSTVYFAGSMSDAALFTSQLTATQVAAAYQASKSSSGLTPLETQTVTDPGNKTITYQMDPLNGDRIIAQTDALGNTTKFSYDTNGFQDRITDPNGNVTLTGHDGRGNVLSQTTCQDQATNSCSTGYMTYYPPGNTGTTLTADPRNDLMLTNRGPGSASATDTAYLTAYTYTSQGEVQTETGPPVSGFPAGRTTTYSYSSTSTPAYNSSGQQAGTTPPGLLLTKTTAGGAVTSYEYYSDGDVYQVTDPDGMRTTYTYDGLGRKLSQTASSSTYPAGLTTTYAYDQMGQMVTETDPTVTDPAPGTPHTAQTTTSYDADGDVLSQTVSDLTPTSQGGDPARPVTKTYNSLDQLASSTDGAGNTTNYLKYDGYGNLTSKKDAAGNITNYTYDPDGRLLTQVLAGYTGTLTGNCQQPGSGQLAEAARSYDPAGQLASETDANCNTTAYTYTGNGLVSTITRCTAWAPATGCGGSTYTEQVNTYNAANQLMTRVTNNGQTTTRYTPDAAGRVQSQTVDPGGTGHVNRTTAYSYSPDDAVLTQALSVAGSSSAAVTDHTYDPMGNLTSRTVHDDNPSLAPSGWWPLSQSASSQQASSAETYATDESGNGNTGILSAGASSGTGGAIISGGSITGSPSAINDPVTGNTEVFATGTSGALQEASYSKATPAWSWTSLGGSITGSPSAINDPVTGNTEVFATGTSGALQEASYSKSTGTWSWTSLGGSITGSPSAIYDQDSGNMEVFATGTSGALQEAWYVPGAHNWDWTSLGGSITGSPSPINDPVTGNTDVFATSTSGALWAAWYTKSTGTWGTISLGGSITGSPSAIYDQDSGNMEVFATGTSGAVQEAWYVGSASSTGWDWTSLGGSVSGSPRAFNDPVTRNTDVYATSTSGALWAAWYTKSTGTWGTISLGGSITGSPTPIYDQDSGNMEVFATGTSGAVQEAWYVGSASSTGWDWTSLGSNTGAITTTGPAINTTGSFAVSAWVNVNNAPTGNWAVAAQAGTNVDGFNLGYLAGSGWEFALAHSDATSASYTRVLGPAAQPGTWTSLTGVYNAATQTAQLYVNGALAGSASSATTFNATGPVTIGSDQWNGQPADYLNGTIQNVQAYPYPLASSQVSQLYGEGRTGAPLGTDLQTTSWKLDQRGLPTSMTNPNGNTTSYVYDQAGRIASTTDPVVTTQVHGIGALAVAPVSYTGYNTFGEPVLTKDPNGNAIFTSYYNDGRPATVTEPDYTPPDGSGTISSAHTSTTYTSLGQVHTQTDLLGNLTSYTYDQLGDVTSKATPAGTTYYSYDQTGEQLKSTSPAGAATDATYDLLGRQVTSTQEERYPTAASYTTITSYAGAGGTISPWVTSVTTPGTVTSYAHDNAGEQTSVTDGAGDQTQYTYDAAGRLTTTKSPDGTYTTTTYDEAGNPVGQADYPAPNPTPGPAIRSASATFDNNGNQLTATDYNKHTTSFTYDAMNRLTGEVQPQTSTSSITTAFGYDAAGNPTWYQDGNLHIWWTTYNSWNLPESRIEPATTAAPAAADGTFTTSYNADGNPVQVSEPGGITVTDSYYDNVQWLKGQAGNGASAATVSRSFGYDADGRLTSASAPGGTDTYTLNDRGMVLTASGPSGTSSFAYNGDGLTSSVTDAAGTTSYTYDNAGRLSTLADPATSTTLTYNYTLQSQLSQISYGSGGNVQKYGYNNLHQLTSDTLQTAGGTTLASIGYGYDANGNLASKNTTGFGAPASNTYNYNYANELHSWNNGTATVLYAYDGAGNRTQVGAATFNYDERDQLKSNGASTYAYTMAGVLASVTGPGGTTNYTSDAFGQTMTGGSQTYAYDALGRLVTAGGGFTFSYDGTSQILASDGASTYTWNPAGTSLAGIGIPGSTSSGVLAITDAHTDVVGTFTPTGSSLTGSASYDPLGNLITASAMTGRLGYQSAWTDQTSNQVHMGARWYNPATGQFISRDTTHLNPSPNSAAANPFAYAADNPLTGTDPTGKMVCLDNVCGAATGKGSVGNIVSTQQANSYNSLWQQSLNQAVGQCGTNARCGQTVIRTYHNPAYASLRVAYYASQQLAKLVVGLTPGHLPSTRTTINDAHASYISSPRFGLIGKFQDGSANIHLHGGWGSFWGGFGFGGVSLIDMALDPWAAITGKPGPLSRWYLRLMRRMHVATDGNSTFGIGSFAFATATAIGGEAAGALTAASDVTSVAAEEPTAALGDTSNLLPGYTTFAAAKNNLGSPGIGNVFDHTVEQSQIGRSGFAPEEIHSPYNLNPVPSGLNQLKANYYSSIRPFTGGMTVRAWLGGQSFADQYEFSMDIMMMLRNGTPLP
jgi:RHS repeat-associated protein